MQEPRPSDRKRLHPSAIGVWVIEGVARFGLGAIALIIVDPESLIILLGSFVLIVVASVLRFYRFSYQIEDDTLVVQGGFLNTWRRVIPLPRIQSINVVRKLRHRLFGVLEIRVEAAGGRQTEAALVAVTPGEAEQLRASLLARPDAPPRPEADVPPLARLGPGMLIVAGVTGGRVPIIAALLGSMQELLPEGFVLDLVDRLGQAGRASLILLIAAVIAFLTISLIISVIGTVLVYWDFTLRRDGDRVVVTRGLLETRRAVVPLTRLQALRIDQNLLRLAFGLVSVRAVTAGFGAGSEEEKETSVLLPVATRSQALAIVAHLLGRSPERLPTPLERPTGRSLVRRVVYGTGMGLVAGLAGLIVLGPAGAAGFGLIPLGALLGLSSFRALGHTMDEAVAVAGWGAFVRKTMFVPVANLQHLSLEASPVQRLLDLGTVNIEIPGGKARAIDLARLRAEQRFDQLARKMIGP